MTHILETTIDPHLYFCNHEDESTNAHVKERILHILGYIPFWLYNPHHANKDIVSCIDAEYQHGGGWQSFKGHTHKGNGVLSYPDDPDMYPLVKYVRTTEDGKRETAYQYEHGWMMVLCDDGAIRVARID